MATPSIFFQDSGESPWTEEPGVLVHGIAKSWTRQRLSTGNLLLLSSNFVLAFLLLIIRIFKNKRILDTNIKNLHTHYIHLLHVNNL